MRFCLKVITWLVAVEALVLFLFISYKLVDSMLIDGRFWGAFIVGQLLIIILFLAIILIHGIIRTLKEYDALSEGGS